MQRIYTLIIGTEEYDGWSGEIRDTRNTFLIAASGWKTSINATMNALGHDLSEQLAIHNNLPDDKIPGGE